MLRKGFLVDITIERISIGTEKISIDNKEKNISYIEIVLRR